MSESVYKHSHPLSSSVPAPQGREDSAPTGIIINESFPCLRLQKAGSACEGPPQVTGWLLRKTSWHCACFQAGCSHSNALGEDGWLLGTSYRSCRRDQLPRRGRSTQPVRTFPWTSSWKQMALLTPMKPPHKMGPLVWGEVESRKDADAKCSDTEPRPGGPPYNLATLLLLTPFSGSHPCGMKCQPTLLASWAFCGLRRGSKRYSLNRTGQSAEEGIFPHQDSQWAPT